jgi:AmiR/NasT family two-component response regulator
VALPRPLPQAVTGALNLYATEPASFDPGAIELATTLRRVRRRRGRQRSPLPGHCHLAESMRRAMQTRAIIEQAKGIIIAHQHCTPEHAFEVLTRLPQSTHRKLRDCAADLVTRVAHGT